MIWMLVRSMIWFSEEFSFHTSVIMLKHKYCDIMIIRYAVYTVYQMHLRWFTVWFTTNNHYDRSWGDCPMSRSSLSQVSNILPVSVFVFGDCWYPSRWFTLCKWTLCIAANDQDTFLCLSGGVSYYSENKIIRLWFQKLSLAENNHLKNLHTHNYSKMGNRPIFSTHLLPYRELRSSIHQNNGRENIDR